MAVGSCRGDTGHSGQRTEIACGCRQRQIQYGRLWAGEAVMGTG